MAMKSFDLHRPAEIAMWLLAGTICIQLGACGDKAAKTVPKESERLAVVRGEDKTPGQHSERTIEKEPVSAPLPLPDPAPASATRAEEEKVDNTPPPAPEFPPPPVETVLVPGARLVYTYAGYLEDSDGTRFATDIMVCKLDRTNHPQPGFRVTCSDIDRAAMSSFDTLWEPDVTYYWTKQGLCSVGSDDTSAQDGCEPVIPVHPTKHHYRKTNHRALGSMLTAYCYVTPDTDEPGDRNGYEKCLTPKLGPVSWRPWTEAGWVDEEDFRLVHVLPPDFPDVPRPAAEHTRWQGWLQEWVATQNEGDYAAYSGLYGEKLAGVRRSGHDVKEFDREGWLEDRRRMFKKPMAVHASDIATFSHDHTTAIVFIQHWQSGKYADWGPKLLLVDSSGDTPLIVFEEMLWSKKK